MDKKEINKILKRIDHHRLKRSNKAAELVAIMVEEGVYKDTPLILKWKNFGWENPFLTMVITWGARWFEYSEPHFCPHCNADLRDYTWGPPGKREIAHYSQKVDCTLYDICPECRGMVVDRRFRDDPRIA